MKKVLPFVLLLLAVTILFAFKRSKSPYSGYKKIENGSYYKLLVKGKGNTMVDTGGAVFMKVKFKTEKDSVFMNVNEQAKMASFPILISQPKFKGDFLDIFMKMHAGDSASFFVRLDSLKKNYPNQFEFRNPKFDTMKYLGFAVKFDSIFTHTMVDTLRAQDARKKASEQTVQQKIAETMTMVQQNAANREGFAREKNDSLLKPNLIRLNFTSPPDEDGIYFQTIVPGKGDKLQLFNKVSVRYTGSFLDGTIFDSNALVPGQQLLGFTLGIDPMIPGFTKCIYKMHPGERAVFILPPLMGYKDGISRVFEVEIVSVETNH